jgi:hypothetical protein
MSNNSIARLSLCVSLALFGGVHAHAQKTINFLDAPVVKSSIAIRWSATGKVMQVSLDGRRYHDLQSNSIFEGKGPIQVLYDQLNPLNVRAAATVKAVDDPGFTALSDFFKAAQTVTGLVIPTSTPAPAAGISPPACAAPYVDFEKLRANLYWADTDTLPKYLSAETRGWISAIDAGFQHNEPGWTAVGDGVAKANSTASDMNDNLVSARSAWKTIYDCSQNASTNADNRALYLAVVVSRPDVRISQIDQVRAAIVKLAKALQNSYVSDDNGTLLREKWAGDKNQDYVIQDVTATRDKMQEVTVKLTTMKFNFPPDVATIALDTEDLGSGVFTIQKYLPFVIEKSVGAVFGTLKQPTYGTATNADGKTVIARSPDQTLSVNPAAMVNFVCRCAGGLPMLQIGAATSKDLPAFLVGGGIRLFGLGKGDFGVTYGAMIGWYKELNKLQVGSVVTGTADINSDLTYKPHIKSYFGIQYAF